MLYAVVNYGLKLTLQTTQMKLITHCQAVVLGVFEMKKKINCLQYFMENFRLFYLHLESC